MKKLSLSLFALLGILFMLSCSSGGEETATEETITTEETTVDGAPAASGTYAVDLSASTLTWRGEKKLVNKKHYGTIDLAGGQVELADGNIASGTFTIDMTTINNIDLEGKPESKAKLEGHLKSNDFFGVENHPTATFAVTASEVGGEGNATHTVTGDLTIKGITNPITFPVTVSVEGDQLTATGKITFDRSKYDVRYGSESFFDNLGDEIIRDEIVIELELIANATGA